MVTRRSDVLGRCHPLVSFAYFSVVLAGALAISHPLGQLISLSCALMWTVRQEGGGAVRFALLFCLPMLLLTALINPAFSHEGVTVLSYLPSGNPLTLESILYGLSAGSMLCCTLLWFRSFSRVMTADKFIWLFGRVLPAASLVLTMTLRFVPRFVRQMSAVARAQRGLGRDVGRGGVWRRVKRAVSVLSATVTWALENAAETADSMKSRGYGLRGRTAFSIYRLARRDAALLCWVILCGLCLLCGGLMGLFDFTYFPSVRAGALTPLAGGGYLIYLALCITPVALNAGEERLWNSIHSKM